MNNLAIPLPNDATYAKEGQPECVKCSHLAFEQTHTDTPISKLDFEAALRESEERNRAMLKAIPDLMFLQNREGVFLDFHTPDLRQLLVPPEEFLGKEMREVLPPELANQFLRCFEDVLKTNEPSLHEYSLPLTDGTSHFEARMARCNGNKILTLVRDITERKQAEEAQRESKEIQQLFIENAPAALAIFDREMRYLAVSRRWLTDFDLSDRAIIGCSHYEIFPEIPERWKSVHRHALEGEVLQAQEDCFERANGNIQWLRWEVRPWHTANGAIGGIVIFVEEITERKRIEEELRQALLEVRQLKDQLQAENVYLQEEVRLAHDFDQIIGHSGSLKSALLQVEQVAPTESTVLITGETGTGKELIAHAIHSINKRRNRPLIRVNCASLPATLIESELFGHEKGAFTGASNRRTGRFELAHGGTLFLDEIGELPLELQAKLLRVLQEGEFERLGSSRTTKVDVRVLAATNQDLEAAVRAGSFRADLYYRLSVFPIRMPPLRERPEDIRPLVSFFVAQFSLKMSKRIETIPTKTMEEMERYAWPGNVRELKNVIERAVILSTEGKLRLAESLQVNEAPKINQTVLSVKAPEYAADPVVRLQEVERDYILRVMEQTFWRVEGEQGAAAILGLNPGTLRSRLKKLGLRRPILDT